MVGESERNESSRPGLLLPCFSRPFPDSAAELRHRTFALRKRDELPSVVAADRPHAEMRVVLLARANPTMSQDH